MFELSFAWAMTVGQTLPDKSACKLFNSLLLYFTVWSAHLRETFSLEVWSRAINYTNCVSIQFAGNRVMHSDADIEAPTETVIEYQVTCTSTQQKRLLDFSLYWAPCLGFQLSFSVGKTSELCSWRESGRLNVVGAVDRMILQVTVWFTRDQLLMLLVQAAAVWALEKVAFSWPLGTG